MNKFEQLPSSGGTKPKNDDEKKPEPQKKKKSEKGAEELTPYDKVKQVLDESTPEGKKLKETLDRLSELEKKKRNLFPYQGEERAIIETKISKLHGDLSLELRSLHGNAKYGKYPGSEKFIYSGSEEEKKLSNIYERVFETTVGLS